MKLELIAIPDTKNLFTFLILLYSKQTTFWQRICRSPPHRLLCIIVRAAKLPEWKKIKAKICHHFKKLWIYSAPCPESANSVSVERRASHHLPSEWVNREREGNFSLRWFLARTVIWGWRPSPMLRLGWRFSAHLAERLWQGASLCGALQRGVRLRRPPLPERVLVPGSPQEHSATL